MLNRRSSSRFSQVVGADWVGQDDPIGRPEEDGVRAAAHIVQIELASAAKHPISVVRLDVDSDDSMRRGSHPGASRILLAKRLGSHFYE